MPKTAAHASNRLISYIPFWLNVFLILSAIQLIAPLQHSIHHLNISLLEKVIGFILQFPIIVIVATIDYLLQSGTAALPLPQNLTIILRLCSRIIVCYLLVFYYIASTIIYSSLGVFVSYEVLQIAVLDFGHMSAILFATAGAPLLGVLVALSISILACQKIAPRFPKLFISLPKKLFYTYCLCFIITFIYSLNVKDNNPNFVTNVFKNSFPPTFLLGQTLDKISDTAGEPVLFNSSILTPQISMEEYQQQAGPLTSAPPVIFIMLESISYNHLGFTGYTRKDITPNLDSLFSHSIFFDRTYTPSNHSNLSQGSILASQYSLRRIRLETFQEINYVKPMLFDILHAYGYETAIYSAQDENWLGMRRFIESNNAKIDNFKHALDFKQYYQFFDGKIDDADLIHEANNYLSNIRNPDKPPFIYVNLQRTHFDYRLKPDVKGQYGEADSPMTGTFFNYGEHQKDKALLMYDNALHYVDAQLGTFFEHLKQEGLYDEAIIIISADHGEAFYENGYPTHATSMLDAQIRTFTSIKLPYQQTGVYRQDAISSVDIMPMALEALGLMNHPAFQGFQLLNHQRSPQQPIFSTGQSLIRADAAITQPWKFYISEKEGPVLFNLAADPKEKQNLYYSNPEQADVMRQHLQHYREYQTNYYIHAEQRVRDDYYAPKYQ